MICSGLSRALEIIVRKTETLRVASVTFAVASLAAASLGSVHAQPKTETPASAAKGGKAPKPDVKLITLDPGHFHAALIHREAYANVDPRVHVFAPLGPDLLAHLKRVSAFNLRPQTPTDWRLEVHTGPDFLDRLKKEKPGNVVVISGRNRGKIDYIQASVASGFHALVDKPWILSSDDFGKLKDTLDLAQKKGRIAYDMMTERFEITTILQKELVNDPDVFGQVLPGTPADPSVYMESVHHLMKVVSGAPNIRPAWFFDRAQQGEGANDIGTHLVDLVPWTLFPGQGVDYQKEIEMVSAQRWPTVISKPNFQRVTGEKDFPDFLKSDVKNDALEYFCNTLVTYKVRGVHTKLNIIWDWEAPAGSGDTHFAFYKGNKARIEVRQGKADKYRPELYVVPADPSKRLEVVSAVGKRLSALQAKYPGLTLEEKGKDIHVVIPDRFRTSHEEHFAEVARNFFGYLKNPKSFPTWEKAHMLAKYWVTTKGTEMSRQSTVKVAERIAPK
jgi:predicted dehydrogenase